MRVTAEKGVPLAEAAERCRLALRRAEEAVVGKSEVLERVLAGLLAPGHLLLEDVPGVGKTLVARTFARILGLSFRRIQFVPDLLPADVTGGMIYDAREGRFEFRKGPIFAHLLLADEINRGTPKTQAALLEAMQEGQVSMEGTAYPLEPPFLVLATQNPLEFEGTYPLPEAQLDRFLARIRMGYPSREAERELISEGRSEGESPLPEPLLDREGFLAIRAVVERVHVAPELRDYIVCLVRATREEGRVRLGASPRGTLALFRFSRALALVRGRDFVVPEDIRSGAVPVLAHRILLRPDLWGEGIDGEDVLEEILERLPVPGALS